MQRVGENVPKRKLVIVTLRGLPSIWETFNTAIRNNNTLSSFYEIVGNITQEESSMISRCKFQNHEGETATFVTQNKKKKVKGGP